MSSSILGVLAAAGLLVTTLAAIAIRVLQDYSRRELEGYCQERNRLDLFGEILDEDENVLVAWTAIQIVGIVTAVLAVAPWFYRPTAEGGMAWTPFIGGLVFTAGVAVTVVVWLPATVARLWAAPLLYRMWPILSWTVPLVWPLTFGLSLLDKLLRRLANRPVREEDEEEAFEEEIRSIVTEGFHEGLLEEEAMEMIEGVIELGDADVSDIMTPRSNIDACDADLGWPDVLKFVVTVGRTRIPVFERTLDNIIGVLYVKDLLREISLDSGQLSTPLRQVIRSPWFVPTTKPLDEMLHEFQQTRNHLAIVVDEYRSVAGVVSIEDVLEEIVGEIEDESDEEQVDEIEVVDDRVSEVMGSAHIDLVNERLGLSLPEPDDCDTIAGLLIRELGKIPEAGAGVRVDGARITVLSATRRRVEKLRIEIG